MDHGSCPSSAMWRAIPRVPGDLPVPGTAAEGRSTFAPPRRGWPKDRVQCRARGDVLPVRTGLDPAPVTISGSCCGSLSFVPALAGMDPFRVPLRKADRRLPRLCGDEPILKQGRGASVLAVWLFRCALWRQASSCRLSRFWRPIVLMPCDWLFFPHVP